MCRGRNSRRQGNASPGGQFDTRGEWAARRLFATGPFFRRAPHSVQQGDFTNGLKAEAPKLRFNYDALLGVG